MSFSPMRAHEAGIEMESFVDSFRASWEGNKLSDGERYRLMSRGLMVVNYRSRQSEQIIN